MKGWISLPRLLEHLDQILQKPVVLIYAHAGFGRTTLVSRWLDLQSDPSLFVRNLDHND